MSREGRTDFDPTDAPPEERDRYRQQRNLNQGYWHGRADSANWRESDRRHLFETIASRLELTEHAILEGYQMFNSLDLSRLGRPLEVVIFCVCSLAARSDGREYHPSRNDENNDELFLEFAEELDATERNITSCWSRLHQEFRED